MTRTKLRGKAQNLWQSPKVSHWRHMFSVNRAYRYLTAEKRLWPHFIVPGAQKSGTTSLYSYLESHPDMVPPIKKELAFFDRNFHRGTQWYRMHFPLCAKGDSADGSGKNRFTGESSSY
jgi:hypothetical protein